MSFAASSESSIDAFESIVLQHSVQNHPAVSFSRLDLDYETMLRCVCLDTVPPSSFEVQRCVPHTLGSDVNEFLNCFLKSSILPKTNLTSLTSIWLVESTDLSR